MTLSDASPGHLTVARDSWAAASESLERYVEILRTRGIEWGLIGPREADRLWQRHVLNSLALLPFVPSAATVIDVGSGAGLPGIPLALVRPDVHVTLLEPLLRRWNFLVATVADLGLEDRVEVRRGRAEDERQRFDVVAARAVAPLPKLIGWCAPLVGGSLLALKGRSAPDEVRAARPALRAADLTAAVHEVTVEGSDGPTWLVRAADDKELAHELAHVEDP